jgi:predicted phosphoribosyltransferase
MVLGAGLLHANKIKRERRKVLGSTLFLSGVADRPEPNVSGKTVILVDDGLATGSTMRAAAAALRQQNPASIVVAVPVSAPQTCDEYRMGVGEIICAMTPEPFLGVGQWYRDFSQTTDEEVRELLEKARDLYGARTEDHEMAHS